ncbi:hypothetical protein JCM19046_1612 [Bacillus sp. JCM 19046]|nr:hypothetical protein JCM19045_197 [Bacillus sp. JCM 19045]GAF17129.1 hypothetical protein JCM19046_1612 [Bacillus sp. JCM 19046]
MKKILFTSILSSTVLLTACGSDDANGDADNNDQETPTEESATEENESDTNGENSMTGEDVLNEAIALYDDVTSLYVVREGALDQNISMPDDEEAGDAEIEMNITETQLQVIQDGDFYQRNEHSITSIVNEEGQDPEEQDMGTTVSFTDADDPNYLISYDEGDTEAIRYEGPDTGDFSFSEYAYPYEQMLENGEVELIGEEEINGYQTYHISVEEDGEVTEFWFDTETFFEIQSTLNSESESQDGEFQTEGGGMNTVVEYELNIEPDMSQFQAPDDIEVVDGEIEDTIG